MKGRMMRKIVPVAAALLLVAGAQFIRSGNDCCGGSLPFALILSPLGCTEAKHPVNAIPDDKVNGNAGKSAEAVKAEHRVTFVEIGSINCVPCKMMQPIMKAVEEEYKGQVRIVFHDVWTPRGKQDAMKYGIRVIPTQVFLDKNGKEYYRHEGFFPKEELVKVLKMKGVR